MTKPDAKGHIRKLWQADKPAFLAHLLRLDFESRRRRFAMAASDAFIERYVETCFHLDSTVHGYFEDGELRGVGELRFLDTSATSAEAAFSVEADWQGKGIGTELMEHTILTGRNRGIRRVYMNCLASNRSMQKMARSAGAELDFEAGEVVGLVLPPHASTASYVREAVLDTEGWATGILDLQRRLIRLPFLKALGFSG